MKTKLLGLTLLIFISTSLFAATDSPAPVNCEIKIHDSAFFVMQGDHSFGNGFVELADAVKVRDLLVAADGCVIPNTLPKCSVDARYGSFFLMVGDKSFGSGFADAERFLQAFHDFKKARVCN